VTFLGKEVSRAWFAESSVASFDGHETLTDLGQLSYRGKSFKRTVEKALENAKTALAYSPEFQKKVLKVRFQIKTYLKNRITMQSYILSNL